MVILAGVVFNIIVYGLLSYFGIRNLMTSRSDLSLGGRIFRIVFLIIIIPSGLLMAVYLLVNFLRWGIIFAVIVAIVIVLCFVK